MTQKELATALGLDQSAVNWWEHGKCGPLSRRLPQIAKILECSIEELLTPDEQEDET